MQGFTARKFTLAFLKDRFCSFCCSPCSWCDLSLNRTFFDSQRQKTNASFAGYALMPRPAQRESSPLFFRKRTDFARKISPQRGNFLWGCVAVCKLHFLLTKKGTKDVPRGSSPSWNSPCCHGAPLTRPASLTSFDFASGKIRRSARLRRFASDRYAPLLDSAKRRRFDAVR